MVLFVYCIKALEFGLWKERKVRILFKREFSGVDAFKSVSSFALLIYHLHLKIPIL